MSASIREQTFGHFFRHQGFVTIGISSLCLILSFSHLCLASVDENSTSVEIHQWHQRTIKLNNLLSRRRRETSYLGINPVESPGYSVSENVGSRDLDTDATEHDGDAEGDDSDGDDDDYSDADNDDEDHIVIKSVAAIEGSGHRQPETLTSANKSHAETLSDHNPNLSPSKSRNNEKSNGEKVKSSGGSSSLSAANYRPQPTNTPKLSDTSLRPENIRPDRIQTNRQTLDYNSNPSSANEQESHKRLDAQTRAQKIGKGKSKSTYVDSQASDAEKSSLLINSESTLITTTRKPLISVVSHIDGSNHDGGNNDDYDDDEDDENDEEAPGFEGNDQDDQADTIHYQKSPTTKYPETKPIVQGTPDNFVDFSSSSTPRPLITTTISNVDDALRDLVMNLDPSLSKVVPSINATNKITSPPAETNSESDDSGGDDVDDEDEDDEDEDDSNDNENDKVLDQPIDAKSEQATKYSPMENETVLNKNSNPNSKDIHLDATFTGTITKPPLTTLRPHDNINTTIGVRASEDDDDHEYNEHIQTISSVNPIDPISTTSEAPTTATEYNIITFTQPRTTNISTITGQSANVPDTSHDLEITTTTSISTTTETPFKTTTDLQTTGLLNPVLVNSIDNSQDEQTKTSIVINDLDYATSSTSYTGHGNGLYKTLTSRSKVTQLLTDPIVIITTILVVTLILFLSILVVMFVVYKKNAAILNAYVP